MNRENHWKILATITLALTFAGCGGDDQNERSASGQSAPQPTANVHKPGTGQQSVSPGKITAPISIDYSIVGNPMVGQPVSINLEVSSPLKDRAITVHYRVNEAGSLTFPESQLVTTALLPLANTARRRQQVTVVPQREGRLYLVVSAEIETDSGTMIRSMSIPIQVGRAPREATLNGELVEGPDGEVGISMPAKEP